MSDELENLRQKRLRELQEQAMNQQQTDEESKLREKSQQEYEAQKQQIIKQILSEAARQRLNNIKLVKPQLADAVENQLIQLHSMGKLQNNISEQQLLQMLKQIQNTKRDSTIQFKRV